MTAAVDEIRDELARWHVPGMQLAAVREGEVVYAGGVGVLGVDDPRPVTASTLFHHGSCAKAYTAMLAVLLAGDGSLDLDLDRPVRRYVPELRLRDPVVADRVTTRDLLSHRSGLARHDLAWIFNPSWSRAEVVRRLEHLPLAADLRERWAYSNFGYALAGEVIGRVTDSTWEDQLAKLVLEPIGMTATTTSGDVDGSADVAAPHVLTDGAPTRTSWRHLSGLAPAGQLMTTADDAARWLLLQTGEPLLDRSAAETHQPAVPLPSGLVPFPGLSVHGYGLGWLVGSFYGRPLVWHSGGVDGFLTQAVLLPEQRIGVLASANLHSSSLPMAAALHLVDGLLGSSAESATATSWFDRIRVVDAERAQAVSAARQPAPRSSGRPRPTHAIDEYAATYTDPGYGDLVVTVDGSALQCRLGESELRAAHRHYDTWDLHYEPLEHDVTATFVADAGGVVAEAVLPLEPATAPIRFQRVAGG